MVASQECRDDRAASGREDRRTDPGNEGEREDQSERRIEDEQDRNRADDDRAHEVTPEHRAAWTHRISNGTAEESEERIGNARDANRESCQQRRLCCTVRYEGERDERDRVTEAADDLGEPEEREVRRSHAVCSWVRFFLQPHERDEEAAERDQQKRAPKEAERCESSPVAAECDSGGNSDSYTTSQHGRRELEVRARGADATRRVFRS